MADISFYFFVIVFRSDKDKQQLAIEVENYATLLDAANKSKVSGRNLMLGLPCEGLIPTGFSQECPCNHTQMHKLYEVDNSNKKSIVKETYNIESLVSSQIQ